MGLGKTVCVEVGEGVVVMVGVSVAVAEMDWAWTLMIEFMPAKHNARVLTINSLFHNFIPSLT